MTHPTEPELKILASETGYEELSLEKMLRLYDVLQAIERDRFLRDRLALKGGTALNAFHFDLERLSLDIDLVYISAIERDVTLAERKFVNEKLLRVLNDQGCAIKEIKFGRDGSKLDMRFDSALGGISKLHVDTGYVDRQPLFGASRMTSFELGGRKAADILVLDLEDVIMGKLAALTQRCLARDIFDAMSIKEIKGDLDMKSIRAAFISYVASSREGWENLWIGARSPDPHEACHPLCSACRSIFAAFSEGKSGCEVVQ